MKLTFLGTGTSQGVPVIGCSCEVCRSADRHNRRLRTSAMVEVGGLRLIIDAGPDFREQMLREDVRHIEGAEASYMVIDHTYKSGDADAAEKLIYDFADKNTPHSYWLGKAFILLGDIYRSKGDTFQARATYQSVVDGYTPTDDGIVDEAKARIAQLN